MSNADSLYKAHSNNSFDSESQYTGRYLKLFEEQTKNSKIGPSIFSYEQKKEQVNQSPILSSHYAPLSYENQSHNHYSYTTREEKQNEIFGDLDRMRKEHLKIMGLMEERDSEDIKKMGEIEKEITQRRSVQHYMPEYTPTFNNLNSREGRNSVEFGEELKRKGSVENYITYQQEMNQGNQKISSTGEDSEVLKQEEINLKPKQSNDRRFTFSPSPNYFIPDLQKESYKPNQYQMDSPHHNLKDTIQFEPSTNPQFVHYEKYQEQERKPYRQFSDESLNYSEMKEVKKVGSILPSHFREEEERDMILGGNVKVVESKLESGGKLITDSKVIERETFSRKPSVENTQQIPSRSDKGPPETSIKMIQMRQTSKNIAQQSNSGNRISEGPGMEYQVRNEVLAKVSTKQDRHEQVNKHDGQLRGVQDKVNQPPLNPQALLETVQKQLNHRDTQLSYPLESAQGYQAGTERRSSQNMRPTSSYQNLGRQEPLRHEQMQAQYQPYQPQFQPQPPPQPPIQPRMTQTQPSFAPIQASFNTKSLKSEGSLLPPLSPRSPYAVPPLPMSSGLKKQFGLPHHNRFRSPSRRLEPQQFHTNPNVEYPARAISDHYYNMAKEFPSPYNYQLQNDLRRRLINPQTRIEGSPARMTNLLRPTSSGPRALSPRPTHHPSTYVPTALLPQNNRNNIDQINRNRNLNLKLAGMNTQLPHQPIVNRPYTPGGLSPRNQLIRPTSVGPQTHRVNPTSPQMRPTSPPFYPSNPPHTQRATSPPRQQHRHGISVTSKR